MQITVGIKSKHNKTSAQKCCNQRHNTTYAGKDEEKQKLLKTLASNAN